MRNAWRFENDGSYHQTIYVRSKIQTPEGVQEWGQLVYSYSSATDKFVVDYVRVHKPDGHVVTAGPDAIQDLSSPIERVAPMYTDIRQVHVTVPDLAAGDVLEYQVHTDTVTPLVPGQFFTAWRASKEVITLDETLEMNWPASRDVHIKTLPGLAAPDDKKDGDRRILTWHSSFTKRPDESEDEKKKQKSKEPTGPDVQISTFTDWQAVGAWYEGLEEPRAQATDALKAKADEIVKGQTTALGKAQVIFDYVETNVRYVSLSFGLGRYQPHAAGDVLSNEYGDCKDKSTLLTALLATQGIQSRPVLINSQIKIDPDVPSPTQFDHEINQINVDGKTYWADSTSGGAPFGFLFQQLRDKQALVVLPAGKAELEKTPIDPPFASSINASVDGKVDGLGRLQGKLSFTVTGDYAVYLRSAARTLPQSRWSLLSDRLAGVITGATAKVSDFHFSGVDDPEQPFKYDASFTAPNFIDLSKKDSTVSLTSMSVDQPSVEEPDKDSTDPLDLGSIRDESTHWKIEFPGQIAVSAPVPVRVTRDYGDYESTYAVDGKTVTLSRHLVIRNSKVPPARYRDVESFSNVISSDEGQELRVTNSAPGMSSALTEMSADDLYDAGQTAEESRNFAEAADLYAAAAAKDPDKENVWNALGHAYNVLEQYGKAVDALQKAIDKNPYDQSAYNNLGEAYRGLGQYDLAVQQFQKQIEINPLDHYSHANLGQTYLDQKKYDLALKELQTALQITPENYGLEVNIGSAQLGLHQDDAALASFQVALEKIPNPDTWNDVAYILSEHAAKLDMAEKYSHNSIQAAEAETAGMTLATVGPVAVGTIASLDSYWDTMGWIKFQEGDLKTAESYILATWLLADNATVADHLGQIYEKEGRHDDAIRVYTLALALPNPPVETRGRLAALIGDKKVDAAVDAARPNVAVRRTIKLANPKNVDASAKFWVLFSPNASDSTASVDEVKFAEGDGKNDDVMKGYADELGAAKLPFLFPTGDKAKIAVLGVLDCMSASHACTFTPNSTEDTLRSIANGSDTSGE